MTPPLPTDDDTNHLFDLIVAELEEQLGYSEGIAADLVRRYYAAFIDDTFCERISSPSWDDDDFRMCGAQENARRLYCFIGFESEPSQHAYLAWRWELERLQRAMHDNPPGSIERAAAQDAVKAILGKQPT